MRAVRVSIDRYAGVFQRGANVGRGAKGPGQACNTIGN